MMWWVWRGMIYVLRGRASELSELSEVSELGEKRGEGRAKDRDGDRSAKSGLKRIGEISKKKKRNQSAHPS